MEKLNKSNKINKLAAVTKDIIKDCALENGGIVASNSIKNYYPTNAKNYFYVWPRDASFTCIASDLLGIDHVQKGFFKWCLNRAEGFRTCGIFFEKYYPNGLKAGGNFQPDQTGALLFALWHHCKNNPDKVSEFRSLIKLAADGICSVWEKDHFTLVISDLWEERFCFPDLKENFTYSLGACVNGLKCANELVPNRKWVDTATEMKHRLDEHFMGYFIRSYGEIPDKRIDASVIGLVYPFEIYDADDPRIIASISEIEKNLITNGGVHRYQHDEYDGWMYETRHRKKGAGTWPLLNFWMSIYYSIKGDKENAEKYFDWVLEKIDNSNHIPEQIFENDIQVSVSPLLWSHTMFVLALRHLQAHP